jgi:hypothetical protein
MMRGLLFVAVTACVLSAGSRAGTPVPAEAEGTQVRALCFLAQASGVKSSGGDPVKCGVPLIAHGLRHRLDGGAEILGALRTLFERPSLQTSVLAGSFRIHFDTTGPNLPAMLNPAHTVGRQGTFREFVDSVAASSAYVYHIEIDSLGYQPPPGDGTNGGGPEMDIYIMDLGDQYGYVAPDSNALPDGGRSSSFMVIDNDFIFLRDTLNRGVPAMHVTLAHEFHHMIQIGAYGLWSTEVYYHEITSVWLEDVVYPSVKDYLQYVWSSYGQFADPSEPFTSNSDIMYSRGVWAHFIAKRFGADQIRHSWEQIRSVRPLQAIDNALRIYSNSSFATAFAEWTLWNYFTGGRSDSVQYYPEGALYRLIAELPSDYSGARRVIPDSLAPLASSYHQVLGASKPLTLITANIDFPSALGGVAAQEGYSYILSPTSLDNGFRATAAGVFVRLDAVNPSHWWSWDVVNGIVGVQRFDEQTPFPNPFIADGTSVVYIPSTSLSGNLSVYSASMSLIYQAEVQSALRLQKRVFSWNGRTNSNVLAHTGVYIYVLSLEDRTVSGKIALVRK